MMSLLDELKSKLDEAKAALETERFYLVAHQSNMREHEAEIADLERAIAALEPAPEAEPEPMHSWESAADEDSLQEAPDQPEQPQSETADETPDLATEIETHFQQGLAAEGWVPVDEFEFPKSEAIVECRWDDAFCETFEFVGYTPTTNEPHWRSTRYESTEADQVITHYRSFAKAEQPQGPSPVEGEIDEGWAKNLGVMPADKDEKLDVKFSGGQVMHDVLAGAWSWSPENRGEVFYVEYYRYPPLSAREENAKPAPVNSIEQPNPEPVGEDA